jgi:hypothetical protein
MSDYVNIKDLANEVRYEFIRQKSKQQGKPAKLNGKQDTFENWVKAANNCVKSELQVSEFVQAAFEKAPSGPFITMLTGPKILVWCKEIRELYRPKELESGKLIEEIDLERQVRFLWRQAQQQYKTERRPVVETVRCMLTKAMPHVRLLVDKSDEMWNMYGYEAREIVLNNPNLQKALKNKGFDLERLIHGLWDRQ